MCAHFEASSYHAECNILLHLKAVLRILNDPIDINQCCSTLGNFPVHFALTMYWHK